MKYNNINSELKPFARNVPYNKFIIKFANIFQSVSFYMTRVPKGIINKHITIKGYKGLKMRVEVFEPSNVNEKLPCLIYIHGGAFSYKASRYHKQLACMYAIKARCRVYFPDYHLTPRYPYPAAYADVLALYKYIMGNAEEFGIDNEKIGVAGDSAGALIAALICNRYDYEVLTKPCVQMLIYPVIDINMQTDSMEKFSDTPLWNSKNNKRMWTYFCRDLDIKDRYEASLMHSCLPQMMPDTYIETAEYDCLHDEGIIYGKRLQDAGVRVEINETAGTFHGYDSAINTNIAMRHIAKRILFLKKGFMKD